MLTVNGKCSASASTALDLTAATTIAVGGSVEAKGTSTITFGGAKTHATSGSIMAEAGAKVEIATGATLNIAAAASVAGAGTLSVKGSVTVNADATFGTAETEVEGTLNIAASKMITIEASKTTTIRAGAMVMGEGKLVASGTLSMMAKSGASAKEETEVKTEVVANAAVNIGAMCNAKFSGATTFNANAVVTVASGGSLTLGASASATATAPTMHVMAGARVTGDVAIAAKSQLMASGKVVGKVAVAAQATIATSVDAALEIEGDFEMEADATVKFMFGATSGVKPVAVTGAAKLNGNVAIDLSGYVATGDVTLMTYASATGSVTLQSVEGQEHLFRRLLSEGEVEVGAKAMVYRKGAGSAGAANSPATALIFAAVIAVLATVF